MTKTESNHATAFIVFFSIIALAINAVQFHKLEHTREVQQQGQAVKEATATHAAYVAQYVNSGFSKQAGIESLALVTVNSDGNSDSAVGTAIANHFKSDTVSISTSFFKSEFVSDKLFASVFDGSTELLKKLDLANSLDGLLLARETVQYTKNPASLDNLITANMTLDVQVVPVSGSIQNKSWKFIATGAGFSKTEAESNAEERLIKKISSDTTMSLGN
jgi:hypothetical protein